MLAGLVVVGLLAPRIGSRYEFIDLAHLKEGPSTAHLFGTDFVGRDVLQRTVFGVRTSGIIALGGAGIAVLVGLPLGILASYFGGWLDASVMRLADLMTAYPAIILGIGANIYFAPVFPSTMVFVYGGIMWVHVARAVRAQVISLRELEFIQAARALGASDARILVRHLLPNVAGLVAVAATSVIGLIVLVDATVEFFGYGFPAEVAPSLGNLVADTVKFSFGLSSNFGAQNYGWSAWFFPGAVLVAILVCLNVIGDALDRALNPRATSR